MVPGAFVSLRKIPLSANGKVDRLALPAPRARGAAPSIGPRSPHEARVAAIWAEVLGLTDVGIHDNFFSLGGHSLLAIRLVSKIRQAFEVDLQINAVFEQPTIAELAERISTLGHSPQARFEAPSEDLPSFGQAWLWLVDRLDSPGPAYNLKRVWTLTGPLVAQALEDSLREIVRRHEPLHSRFLTKEDGGLAIDAPHGTFAMRRIDLRGKAEKLKDLIEREVDTPFDLATGPLLRALLVRLGSDRHVLAVVIHHIAGDGWSMGVLSRELRVLYAANGQPSALPALPIHFSQYAAWERERAQGPAFHSSLDYWTRRLADVPQLLALPTDRPRPLAQSYRGETYRFEMTGELSKRLKALAVSSGATPFMVLLTTFAILLRRYARQEEFIVGTPAAGRDRQELEPLIGFFANTLALRLNLSGSPSFTQLLQQAKQTTIEAVEHQQVPFDHLVAALQPHRTRAHSPLVQVMFTFGQGVDRELDLDGLEVQALATDSKTSMFDLTLEMEEHGGRMRGLFEYRADLFDSDTIARMAACFRVLCRAICKAPDQQIDSFPLLSAAERRRLLAGQQNALAARQEAQAACAHQLFQQQARARPDAVAILFEDERISYRELDQRATKLAHALRELGVRPDQPVGLCFERSAELVVAILAVFKAGGAYLPLDPEYPRERTRFIVEDARLALVLTQAKLRDRLSGSELRIVVADSKHLPDPPADAAPVTVHPASLAYVIYTSGSTGQPKGAMIEHHSLSAFARAYIRAYDVGPGDRVLQFASPCFDTSVAEIFMALCAGATLVVAPRQALLVGEPLIDVLQSTQVTHLLLTPSAASALPLARLDALRCLVCGGEVCSVETLKKWKTPARRCFNDYGPTEATIVATIFEYQGDGHAQMPIGKPLPGVQVYVLDAMLQPVPVGLPGEIFIGGTGVGRGYLNRPELTAASFVFNPHGAGRLYRTGDIGRLRGDGNIEFLGRDDQQVKLRGFRIELREIETVLAGHAGVRDCAVLVREDVPGEMRLVAYVAPTVDSKEALGYMRAKLPDYMVPSTVVSLTAMPLTPNGKLDRKALPKPEAVRTSTARQARTREEEFMMQLWAGALGLDAVSVDDDFFELGGNSLQAVKLAAQIGAHFKVRVPLRLLFEFRSVASLTAEVCKLPPIPSAPPDAKPAQMPEWLSFEQRSPAALIMAGRLAPLDAASIGCFWVDLLDTLNISRDQMIASWCDGVSTVLQVFHTPWGRIGTVRIPIFDDELYVDPKRTLEYCMEGIEVARRAGARTVSLTGLIPSATSYGQGIAQALAARAQAPLLTTGHAVTCSAVVLAIHRILKECGRDIRGETVAFLGLGSIGWSALRLMLSRLPHPRELILADVFTRAGLLAEIEGKVVDQLGYRGRIRTVHSGSKTLPRDFYDARLIVGATNAADVLDVDMLRPGTVIVDDSAPHCFSTARAIARLEAAGDILFTEGGLLRAPVPIQRTLHWPKSRDDMLGEAGRALERRRDLHEIMGCIFSSILPGKFGLQPTLGLVNEQDAVAHYTLLEQLGFTAPGLQCDEFRISAEAQARFRNVFA